MTKSAWSRSGGYLYDNATYQELAIWTTRRVCSEIAGAAHILGMRALYSAGHNIQILATIERREVTMRQDESDPKGIAARCGGTFDKLEQEVASWVYQVKLAT